MLKISHQHTIKYLRYAQVRYVNRFITNIQKQQNMFKFSPLFKKFTNFTGK